MKVVINGCFGGFGLSKEGKEEYFTTSGQQFDRYDDKVRVDPILVDLVELNSELYSGRSSQLKVVEIPDDVEFVIVEYDGREHIAEKHRVWY